MTNSTSIEIENILGHVGIVEFEGEGMFGPVIVKMEGRLIYSVHNASLFFMPKGKKNRGHIIKDASKIVSFELIRKDPKKNALFVEEYKQHNEAVKSKTEREEVKWLQYQEEQQQKEDLREIQREKKQLEEQQLLQKLRSLCDYDKLEKEVFAFYESSGEFYNESTVKNIMLPMLAQIIYKVVPSADVFPKHFFDKKRNPRFCKCLESYTGVKLANTQKKNVEILNDFLK